MKFLHKHHNLYLPLALFAIALAGDLMWWQSTQLASDYEDYSTATISLQAARGDSDLRDAARMDADITATATESDAELRAIEAELNAF